MDGELCLVSPNESTAGAPREESALPRPCLSYRWQELTEEEKLVRRVERDCGAECPPSERDAEILMAQFEAAAANRCKKTAAFSELEKVINEIWTTMQNVEGRVSGTLERVEEARTLAEDYALQMKQVLSEKDESGADIQRKERAIRLAEVAARQLKRAEAEHKAAELSFSSLKEMTASHGSYYENAKSEYNEAERRYMELRCEVVNKLAQ